MTVSYSNDPSGNPVSNPQFGAALLVLAGRVIEFEGRFTF
jgi:hypothetical protein